MEEDKSFLPQANNYRTLKPQSVIRSTIFMSLWIFSLLNAIPAFLLTPCTHQYLDVARYAFDIDVHKLPKTNTELASILMTDLG